MTWNHLIKGVDTPKILPLQVDIKSHRPKERSRYPYINGAIPASLTALDVDGERKILNNLRGRQCKNM